jgi:hypothetical protein
VEEEPLAEQEQWQEVPVVMRSPRRHRLPHQVVLLARPVVNNVLHNNNNNNNNKIDQEL